MPEGPEIYLTSLYINKTSESFVFDQITKSGVSRSPEIGWPTGKEFHLRAESRGKELLLEIRPLDGTSDSTRLRFGFGLSGRFEWSKTKSKHAHLMFSNEKHKNCLSFVDPRRFGGWRILKPSESNWDETNRGPCPLTDFESFQTHVISSLAEKAFDRPLCELLHNQKYFNGIGNYLRAEIMFRGKVSPFDSGRSVLERKEMAGSSKSEEMDILQLCHTVPMEVVEMSREEVSKSDRKAVQLPYFGDSEKFKSWLQCYEKDEMLKKADSAGRTVWFSPAFGDGDLGTIPKKEKKKAKKEPNPYVKRRRGKRASTVEKTASKEKKRRSNSDSGSQGASDEFKIARFTRATSNQLRNLGMSELDTYQALN